MIDYSDSRITAHIEPRTATTRDGGRMTNILIGLAALEIPTEENYLAWICYPGCAGCSTGEIIIDGVAVDIRALTYSQFMDLPKTLTDAWIAKILGLNPAFTPPAQEEELAGINEKKSK
jgi:hypothetical protein